ncbi:adenosylcobinamide-GDP ribazoletransferase [Zavarzinia sp. CC-PAN008]|uniref:adenosylcobinamide-GDP ribazoletransferase n=1 Tax=Zavarzinia sp. CC-PAN008 TaxID=3243332 RepID=UPI003F747932
MRSHSSETWTVAALASDVGAAFGLLTRLPVPGVHAMRPVLAWSFPLVGIVVGGLATLVLVIAQGMGVPALPAALLALAAGALATGGLHEDGLADTADGFSGGATRDRALAIMRDSRIGAHGALALILVVALKASALASLDGAGAGMALIVAAALSRAWMAVLMAALAPARMDGLARAVGRPRGGTALAALGLGGLVTLVLLPFGGAIASLALSALVALWLGLAAARRLGGVTGDVLGATQQATEAAILLAIAAGA